VHDGIEQEFAEGDAGVVVDHFLPESIGHGDRALAEVGIHDEVESLEHGAEVADGALFIEHLAGEVGSGVADKLDISARQIMHGTIRKHQDARVGGAVLAEIEEAETGELLAEGASVFGDDVFGDGMAKIGEAEAIFREIRQGAVHAGESIKAEGAGDAPLGEDEFLLLRGTGPARPDTEPDAAFVADGREMGWLDLHDGDVFVGKGDAGHREGGQGLDIAVGTQGGKVQQQVISDLQATGLAIIRHSDQEIARLAVVRKVVGKSTDGLGKFIRVGAGDRALDAIRLEIGEEVMEFRFRDHKRVVR